jgi:hypothetical protein
MGLFALLGGHFALPFTLLGGHFAVLLTPMPVVKK